MNAFLLMIYPIYGKGDTNELVSDETEKAAGYEIVTFNWANVDIEYSVALCILVACLAKVGK
jgi:hypothetical protein